MTLSHLTNAPRSSRAKAQRLTSILEAHAAWERRTLADLRVAGFNFTTVDQAFRYLAAQRMLARMSANELVQFVADQQPIREKEGARSGRS
jgi:hypothetical protein